MKAHLRRILLAAALLIACQAERVSAQSATITNYQQAGVATNYGSLTVQPVVTATGTIPAGTYVLQGYMVDSTGEYTTGTAALCTTVFGESGYSTVSSTGTTVSGSLSPWVFSQHNTTMAGDADSHAGTSWAGSDTWTFYATSITSSSGTYGATGSFAVTSTDVSTTGSCPAGTVGGTQTMNVTVYGNGYTKTAEPLGLTITNKDAQGREAILYDPNGNTLLTFGVGGNQTGSTQYQPPQNPVLGTYYLGEVVNGKGVSLTTITLAATSTDPEYAWVWSDSQNESANAAATINSGAAGNQGTNGSFTNNSGRSVTLQWQDSTGAVVGSPWSVANGSSSPINGVPVTLPPGGSGTYTLVDTTDGKTLGTVTESNIDGTYQGAGTINATSNPPPQANPSPTPNPTNTGNNPTGIQTGTSAGNTSVNNGNTSISGGSAGATNQDVYNDVKQALLDASQGNPGDGTGDTMPADAVVTDLSGAQSDQTSVQGWASRQINSGSSGFGSVPVAPTIGTTSYAVSFPAIGPLGAFTVDWSGLSTPINLFRALCLIAMNVIFWFANQRAVGRAVE